jgi:NADPH-dependent glutamate synthase beta subunit-like oxidoreductase
MSKVLLNESHVYEGKYVAMKSPEDSTVVGSGESPMEALTEARSNGTETPVLLYVEEQDEVHIY